MIDPRLFGSDMGAGGFGSAAASASNAAHSARRDVRHLEDRLERLSLVCMAMWSLIQDKTNLSEEELLERVRVIDMMDGVADGKASRGVQKCHKCQRTMNPRHQKCLYCGSGRLIRSAFDAV